MITSEWRPDIVRQVDFLQKAGVEVDVFHFRGAKKPINYLKAWVSAQAKLSKNGYDLVHAQWGQSALMALPKRLPLVITYRGSDLEGIVNNNGDYTVFGYTLRCVSKLTAVLADQIIVMSERLARNLPNRPFEIIPSGLDLDLFQPIDRKKARKQLGISLDKRLVLFVTAFGDPVKRNDLARAAVAQLNHKLNVELLIANQILHSQMPIYMNACDALLLTSLYEGSPNVVKEALACNVPVVSVDVGDVRERIGAIEGCVVCEDDKAETLAEALQWVLQRNQRIQGRETVKKLDERLLTERVKAVYHKAINRARKGRE